MVRRTTGARADARTHPEESEMAEITYDLVVVGAGPGGYVAAIRAAQLGLKTALVEKDRTLGGTCLNVGCIPSKALLESSELYAETKTGLARHGVKVGAVELDLGAMMKRKADIVRQLVNGVAFLMKKNGVDRFEGAGRLVSAGEVEVASASGPQRLETRRILVATGSVPSALPGVELDPERVVTSTEALSFPQVPRSLVVIGAGAIGLELGSVWGRLGAKVTVLEYFDRVLPSADLEVCAAARKVLERQGMTFHLGVRVSSARAAGDHAVVAFSAGSEQKTLEAERVLVAAGRRPYTDGLGAKELGVAMDKAGRVEVNERFETSVPGVFAVGDVVRGPMLAHKASEEGIAAVERMAGVAGHVNYDAIPSIVYTQPEIASAGATEEQLKAARREYRRGSFSFQANGRAKALAQTDGFVKLLADAKTDRLLGAHILGPRAGDLIAEVAVAMELGASGEDLARSVHAHPTLAEAVKEAALALDGRALHGA